MKATRSILLVLVGCALAMTTTTLAADPVVDAKQTPAPECALVKCSDQGAGVCGSDGKTYVNACQLTSAKCANPKLTLASEGPCPVVVTTPTVAPRKDKCTGACPRIYLPVCDGSGKQYSNECEFKIAKCKNNKLKLCKCPTEAPATDAPATGCAAMECAEFKQCLVDERTGKGYCADECAPGRCAANEECVLNQVQCFTTPCPPVAQCQTPSLRR